jgi:peptidoglycan/LPS O-acetylase OafA/YrhL
MRGVCALIVLVMHCDLVLNTGHLLNHGYLCVDAFFVLSGFVIAAAYEHRLMATTSFLQFLRARARRLLPVHFLGTAMVAGVVLWTFWFREVPIPGVTLPALLLAVPLALALVPNFLSPIDVAFPVNTVLWSLLDEWVVNVIYARWLFNARMITLAIIALTAYSIMGVYGYNNPYGLCIGMRNSDLIFGLLRAIGGFLSGAVVHRFYVARYLDRIPSVRPELIYSLCFFIASVPTIGATPTFDLIAVLLIPLAVAFLVRSEKPLPRIFTFLGTLSYPLYVSQFAPITIAMALLGKQGVRHTPLLAVPIIAGALCLAWCIARVTQRNRPGSVDRDSRPVGLLAT